MIQLLMDKFVHSFKEIVDCFDTRGGQLLLAFLVFLVADAMMKAGLYEVGKDVALMAVGALFQSMRSDRTANGVKDETKAGS